MYSTVHRALHAAAPCGRVAFLALAACGRRQAGSGLWLALLLALAGAAACADGQMTLKSRLNHGPPPPDTNSSLRLMTAGQSWIRDGICRTSRSLQHSVTQVSYGISATRKLFQLRAKHHSRPSSARMVRRMASCCYGNSHAISALRLDCHNASSASLSLNLPMIALDKTSACYCKTR